ncbi:MAG: putative hydrolase or acyltransferase of alpha/beta superfamily [Bacteroidetes bacterium]|jgi:3-oxoadipate enol-lactonase|nr:putative hydrolase or acyltransferase of alpha/beta superfamily [Bacteroidota bacterium]
MICKTEDNLDIYYEIQGNTNASETIIFLNGLTQSTLSWFFTMQYFKDKYKIVLMDFIFQGQSSKNAEWRPFDQHAKDITKVLDKENIRKPIVIGLSYGSAVAQHFAVLFPERVSKLILISSFAHSTPYFDAIGLGWARALEVGGYNLLLDVMLPNVLSESYFNNPIIPIEAMKEARKEANQNTEAILNLMRATKERGDYRQELKKITTPTLIIHGEKDLLILPHMANEIHLNIKNSKFVIIPLAGHTLNLEYVPEVCGHIIEFLKS